jgi:hypothetical protein
MDIGAVGFAVVDSIFANEGSKFPAIRTIPLLLELPVAEAVTAVAARATTARAVLVATAARFTLVTPPGQGGFAWNNEPRTAR